MEDSPTQENICSGFPSHYSKLLHDFPKHVAPYIVSQQSYVWAHKRDFNVRHWAIINSQVKVPLFF